MRDDTEEVSKNLFSAAFKGIYLQMKQNKLEKDESGEERKASDPLFEDYGNDFQH